MPETRGLHRHGFRIQLRPNLPVNCWFLKPLLAEPFTDEEIDRVTNAVRLVMGADPIHENPPDLAAVERALEANWSDLMRLRREERADARD